MEEVTWESLMARSNVIAKGLLDAGVRGDALDDAVHDVMLRLYLARARYNPKLSGLNTWFYRSAKHYGISYLKRCCSRDQYLSWLRSTMKRGYSMPDLTEVPDDLSEEIHMLGRGCSYEEIARALRKPIGTIRSRINRERNKFRYALPK